MFGVLPIKQMWGFNPLELLEKVEFPNDRLERRLRRTKSARLVNEEGEHTLLLLLFNRELKRLLFFSCSEQSEIKQ